MQKTIAKEISRTIRLGENVISGKELKEFLEKDLGRAAELVENTNVFAEIYQRISSPL